jgi:integrase/recombinase XerC
VEAYENDLMQFKQFICGDEIFNPQEIDTVIVRRWIVFLMNEGYSPFSVNRKLSSLKSFFRYLCKNKSIQSSPIKNVKGPKVNKPLPDFVKEKEMSQLFLDLEMDDSFEGKRDRAILDTFYSTGVRCAELVALKDEDVDWASSLLKVIGKRNKQRLIPFSSQLKDVLLSYKETREEEIQFDKKAFFVRKNGLSLSNSLVYNIVKKRLSSISTQSKRSPHVLRHTFATSMLNNGTDLNAVKELLGHESLSSTEIYTHTTFEELKKTYHNAHPRAKKKEVFMEITIQAIHFEATQKLEMFIQKKVSRLSKFYDGLLSADVTLKVVKPETNANKDASIKVVAPNHDFFAQETADTFEEAIDRCVEKLERQVLKVKEKQIR